MHVSAYLLHFCRQQLLEDCAGAPQHELVAQLHKLVHALHAQLNLQWTAHPQAHLLDAESCAHHCLPMQAPEGTACHSMAASTRPTLSKWLAARQHDAQAVLTAAAPASLLHQHPCHAGWGLHTPS